VRAMFEEQVGWAAEAGVDFVIAETLSWLGEALVATAVIKETGLPAVVTLTAHKDPNMRDGVSPAEACRRLEAAGADVVGLNCSRGPATMLPLLEEIREAVSVPVAALPVPYRTTTSQPSFQSLEDALWEGLPEGRPFPTALDPFTCNRYEIAEFARAAHDLGVSYLGVCCGAAPHHIRSMAEALGRTPAASRYTADMSKHAYLGTDPSLRAENRDYAGRL
jgi:betaine-homocysteine S-methyltransferase